MAKFTVFRIVRDIGKFVENFTVRSSDFSGGHFIRGTCPAPPIFPDVIKMNMALRHSETFPYFKRLCIFGNLRVAAKNADMEFFGVKANFLRKKFPDEAELFLLK